MTEQETKPETIGLKFHSIVCVLKLEIKKRSEFGRFFCDFVHSLYIQFSLITV
jgi:hypothetical protein